MKFRFNRAEMAEALSAISTIAAVRTPKEILKCVRVDAHSDVVLLSATDLEVCLRCSITQVEVDETGETLVVAETFSRIVRECTDEILSVETTENLLHVRGAGSHFQIVTQDVGEFPAIPSMEGQPDITIDQRNLARLVELTVFAAARESTRYAINGVMWEVDGERLTLAATDGRRLAVAHGKLAGGATKSIPQAIVPAKAMTLFGRLPIDGDAQVGIKLMSNQLLLNMGRSMVSTSLVEGKFPQYQDVIPTDCDREAKLDTAEFLGAVRRAALLTNEESKGVRFTFSDGNLTLSSRAPEQGEAEVVLPIEYNSEQVEIGFNPVFLLEVLRVVHSDGIIFAVKEANRPGVIRLGDDYVYVIMPVNLTSA
jgi:DNA polymerase-3 subunit beta